MSSISRIDCRWAERNCYGIDRHCTRHICPKQFRSDHLQSIRLIEDIRSKTLHANFWAHAPVRSYYRWLDVIVSRVTDIRFMPTPPHLMLPPVLTASPIP